MGVGSRVGVRGEAGWGGGEVSRIVLRAFLPRTGDIGEMQGRYREIYGRYRGDLGEI